MNQRIGRLATLKLELERMIEVCHGGQVLLWLPHDQKCLIASLEMPPVSTIDRMCRQTLPSGILSDKHVEEFAQATDNIWIYDQTDTVPAERMLAMLNYAAKELGMNHLMIDSLVKCGIAPDDYGKQKDFVDRLCWIAKTNKVHIHLVHHVRKGDKQAAGGWSDPRMVKIYDGSKLHVDATE